MESKVGRMGSTFLTLLTSENERLAFLWQRQLFQDMPNTPPKQRLEIFESHNSPVWVKMFNDCASVAERMTRLEEYVHDGDIVIARLVKRPSTSEVRLTVFDGEKLSIDWSRSGWGPDKWVTIPDTLLTFPKSFVWSNLHLKSYMEAQ